MSMMLELSSRMIDYLPEEVSKIQRTIELALSETTSEDAMFVKVDSHLSTSRLREGAREFWDVWSNADDYAEPLTEGVGGFPVDKSVLQKNRSKDRNVGRVIDVSGNQVLIINKRSNGDYVVVDKMGKRSVKKAEGLGTTRTETVELNVLDQLDEEDMSASESPNGAKKKAGKTTVVINPKASDLMKEDKAKKDYDGDGKVESGAKEHAGAVHNAIQRKRGGKPDGKDTTGIKEESEQLDEISANLALTASQKADEERRKAANSGDKVRAAEKARQASALYKGVGPRRAKERMQEEKDPCWKGYEMVGMKKKGGRDVPNCVPKEEYIDLATEMLEEGYSEEHVRDVIANLEEGYEVIFEQDGYSVISEGDEILDEEAQFLSDVEKVADWLHAEGVIQNEDQFFELMEDLSEEEIEELYDVVMEATAMAKRGYDETKLRQRAGGGEAADRATSLENRPTYGDANKAQQRQRYARAQRGDFRKTASSNPGLHGYAHKSDDPKVKAKQAARGAQRGALTPNEKKNLNMGMEMIGDSLEEGGMEVRTYSWREVMGESWKGSKKGGKK